MNLKRQQGGFSLIELLIVVAIIGIIATIAVPQLLDAIDRGRQRRTMADMRNIATANGTYRVDEGEYASALSDLSADLHAGRADERRLGQRVPVLDLSSGSYYTIESYRLRRC